MRLNPVRRAMAIAIALSLSSLPLQAQSTGTVRGRVTDAQATRGLGDAQVVVDGTRIGAVTGANGEYTLSGVPAGPRSITFRRLGYQPATRPVNVGAGAAVTIDVALNTSVINLSEIVVTGQGTPTERREGAPSLASVDASTLSRALAAPRDQPLQRQLPGALITQISGGPGGRGI